jgi:hypothetical protein
VRREELLAAVHEHALPLGPFGDPDERDRLEREWEDTLTEGDCLELLGWLRESYRPAAADYWMRRHAQQIAAHVGRAGRRCRGPGLLRCLLELLCDPQRSGLALNAVSELEEPGAYDDLLIGAATGVVPVHTELARVATPALGGELERAAGSPDCPREVRVAIRDILRAISGASTEAPREAEPGAAPGPPGM